MIFSIHMPKRYPHSPWGPPLFGLFVWIGDTPPFRLLTWYFEGSGSNPNPNLTLTPNPNPKP